ncbi:MAG: hypothetical protein JJU29_11830 [Verrucomicrobia bacterium]|nr:hypothetical protein [Verrucomicrobiota bacterium]MCH8513530.1 hypothetical protein [Kiritimatiellia bacterium]
MNQPEAHIEIKIDSCDAMHDALGAWLVLQRDSDRKETRFDDVAVLQRSLKAPQVKQHLTFPCEIQLRESPDFLLKSNNLKVGIEVTRFLSEQRARSLKIAKNENKDIWISNFDCDRPRRKNSDIRNIIRKPMHQQIKFSTIKGKIDQYAEMFEKIVIKKTEKTIQNSDLEADEFWLFIEDHQKLCPLELEELKNVCGQLLSNYWKDHPTFHRIFFISLTDEAHSIEYTPPNTLNQVVADRKPTMR